MKGEPQQTRRILADVAPKLEEKIRSWASSHQMTRKQLIIQALEEYFIRHEKQE